VAGRARASAFGRAALDNRPLRSEEGGRGKGLVRQSSTIRGDARTLRAQRYSKGRGSPETERAYETKVLIDPLIEVRPGAKQVDDLFAPRSAERSIGGLRVGSSRTAEEFRGRAHDVFSGGSAFLACANLHIGGRIGRDREARFDSAATAPRRCSTCWSASICLRRGHLEFAPEGLRLRPRCFDGRKGRLLALPAGPSLIKTCGSRRQGRATSEG